jgi:hypothetical protein
MAGSGQLNLRNCPPPIIVPRMIGVKLEGKLSGRSEIIRMMS